MSRTVPRLRSNFPVAVPNNDEDDVEATVRARGKRYITRAGAERLHAELLHLLRKERPKITAEVSAAETAEPAIN